MIMNELHHVLGLTTTYILWLLWLINSADAETIIKQFLQNMKLVANIHENVQINVEQTQKKQKETYATRKGK